MREALSHRTRRWLAVEKWSRCWWRIPWASPEWLTNRLQELRASDLTIHCLRSRLAKRLGAAFSPATNGGGPVEHWARGPCQPHSHAAVSHRRHNWGMPTRVPTETTPDLFSAPPTVTAAGPSAVPKGKAGPDSPASQQRHFLPNDLAGGLKRLDDDEIGALVAAVTTEAERRGRRPPSPAKEKPVADAKPQRRQEAAEDGAVSLTTSKLNAVRAAFQAGVKPSAIARQFGISQSCQEGTGAGQASRSLISYQKIALRPRAISL